MAYTYDRADQAIQQTISGVDTAFAYNAWGDLTSAADRDNGVTTHAYDAGGRLMSLTPPGATPATYTYDALGRPAVRSIASASLTYRYIGTTPRSYATIPSAGSATYALIDADASRLALDTGGTTAWSLFDLHGDLAATTASGSATIVSALRSDAYGASLDTYTAGSGATAVPWRYQDRLDLSPDPDEPLYDYGARRYRPSLGAFTALDTYPGSALNPLSLNRYLYAHANPTSLIDPSGHCVTCPPMLDGAYTLPTQGANAPVSAAAAQSQVAAAASWAPADATTISKASAGHGGVGPGAATIFTWQGQRSGHVPFAAPGGWYQPNPSNLSWLGQPVGDLTRQERLGRVLAASAAARQIDADLPPEVLLYGLGLAGGVSLAALLVRAGYAAVVEGLGVSCVTFCDDLAVVAEGFAGAPPRLPSGRGSFGPDEAALPAVAFSRARAPGLAQHFDDAVSAGAPTVLTRVTGAARLANRRAALQGKAPAPAGMSLDEYPFACTAQGGAGACVLPVPMLEQAYQGGVLSAFFQEYAIGPGDSFLVLFLPD